MKTIYRLLVTTGLVALTACSVGAADAVPKDLKAKLQQQLDVKKIVSVNPSPIKGLFEIVLSDRRIIYSDAKGDYILVGDLVDVAKKQSVTEARVAELTRTDFSKLPLEHAIKEVRGNGSRKLAVFSDPDCPFCRKLEKESLAGVTNVTIYTFLFPLPMHSDAERKSIAIWCASHVDPTAWRAWMDNGTLPEPANTNCENPIQQNLALGEQLGITGTPALIFASGRTVPGAIAQEQLETLLDGKSDK